MGGRRSGSSRGLLPKVELVDLSDEVDAEAMVRLFGLQDKAARQVDPPGGDERVVGPQLHASIAGTAGEDDALVHELASEVMASGGGVDKQDP